MERRLFWPPFLLTDRRLELKEIVQLGEHEKESNLLTGAPQNHNLAPLGGTSLNQHQRAESSRIHVAGAREIDHQATNTLGISSRSRTAAFRISTRVSSPSVSGAAIPRSASCGDLIAPPSAPSYLNQVQATR